MLKFNTYKEMLDYTHFLNKKSRECTLTESDQLDYLEIDKIEKELQEIKDSKPDNYWIAILTSLMEDNKGKEYKSAYIERWVKANRGGKIHDVKLCYPFIMPKDFDEKSLTAEDILDAGETARTFFEREIVIYFKNNIQVGLPLDVDYEYQEIVYNLYKAKHQDQSKGKERKKSR